LAYPRCLPAYDRLQTREEPSDGKDDPDVPLADWLTGTFIKARYAHRPRMVKRGRKWFSVAHCVAAVLLMRRLKLSCRAAAELLEERDDLHRAMRLTRAPSYGWFFRARRVVQRLERSQRSRTAKRPTPTAKSCAA
jgi:hypothetical protein